MIHGVFISYLVKSSAVAWAEALTWLIPLWDDFVKKNYKHRYGRYIVVGRHCLGWPRDHSRSLRGINDLWLWDGRLWMGQCTTKRIQRSIKLAQKSRTYVFQVSWWTINQDNTEINPIGKESWTHIYQVISIYDLLLLKILQRSVQLAQEPWTYILQVPRSDLHNQSSLSLIV